MPEREQSNLCEELRYVRQQRDQLLTALAGLLSIINDSRGVEGYHLNGDIATWDEFEEVEEARATLAKSGYAIVKVKGDQP